MTGKSVKVPLHYNLLQHIQFISAFGVYVKWKSMNDC